MGQSDYERVDSLERGLVARVFHVYLNSCKPIVALIFPISAWLLVCNENICEPLCAFISELRRHHDSQRRAVIECKRLIVRFVAKERLRMTGARNVVRRVIAITAGDIYILRIRRRTYSRQKISQPRTSPMRNHTPALDTYMTCV